MKRSAITIFLQAILLRFVAAPAGLLLLFWTVGWVLSPSAMDVVRTTVLGLLAVIAATNACGLALFIWWWISDLWTASKNKADNNQ